MVNTRGMKPRRRLPKPEKVSGEDPSTSIRNRLREPLTQAEARRRVLGMTEKLGLEPKSNSRLASWFVDFIEAPVERVQGFKDAAEFLARTKGGSALKYELTDHDLCRVKTDVRNVIVWAVDEKTKVKRMSTAPLDPIAVDLRLHWVRDRVGGRLDKGIDTQDFRGLLLLRFFDLLSSAKLPFALCAACQKIFARRGRQLYCSSTCSNGARPERKKWMRDYMKKRRAKMKRLERKTQCSQRR